MFEETGDYEKSNGLKNLSNFINAVGFNIDRFKFELSDNKDNKYLKSIIEEINEKLDEVYSVSDFNSIVFETIESINELIKEDEENSEDRDKVKITDFMDEIEYLLV